MGTETQFRTFQTPKNYEEALARHGQWIRWIKVLTCPCIDPTTGQADIHCNLCHGRGRIYRNPGPFRIKQEIVKHDNMGRLYPKYTPVIQGTVTVWQQGTQLTVSGTQPADRSHVQITTPWPKAYKRLRIDYDFDPIISVTGEDSEVYDTNLLRVRDARFLTEGRTFEGSVEAVTRVYNATKDETYTVASFQKEFIYLESMGTWQSGDVLEVDYQYLKPFDFLIHSISQKRRYESPYVIDSADATVVTPYWADIAPNDLLTALAVEIPAFSVVDPSHSVGNDEIGDYFDISRLTQIIDANGTEYIPGTDVIVHGRNEIKWLVSKPTVKYTAHFLYHPTYVALLTYDTARHAENKSFVNRVNVMMFDKINREVTF